MRRKDDEKQKNIKDAVIKLILKEGFHGASMSKIAKEAGVSPATVYIYYENKEVMLQDIYVEYAEELFLHIMNKLPETGIETELQADPGEVLEDIIYSYFNYIIENQEIFYFVDQFSSCPSLCKACTTSEGKHRFYRLLEEMKAQNAIRNLQNETLIAVILAPVKAVALDICGQKDKEKEVLEEITAVIKNALLTYL